MADISTFPTITESVIKNNGPTASLTATEAIKAGQVVGFAATGISNAVVPMDKTSGERSIGVAIIDAAAGEMVTVALVGSIAVVANADDTTGIDAGDLVAQNNNSVKGTVSAATETASGATVTNWDVTGVAIEDIAGGGTGQIIVCPFVFTQGNAS